MEIILLAMLGAIVMYVEPGRLDHPALRNGIAVSKMLWLRYAMENGYGIAAKTPDVAIPAGNTGCFSTRCVPFPAVNLR
jgi:hypothetical protein